MLITLILFLLSTTNSYAISEVNYSENYQKEVAPYFETGEAGEFLGKDNVPIAYRIFKHPNERAKLILLPGRSEPIREYAEVIYDLRESGYSIYILSHRGQGESGRMLADSQVQYVSDYNDYVADLDSFIKTKVVEPGSKSKLFLLAHSMGGAIGAYYELKHPNVFTAGVFSAPMLEINTSPYPEGVASWIASIADDLGYGKTFALGQNHFSVVAPAAKTVTSSTVRNQMILDTFEKYPQTEMGGVSYDFLIASFKVMNEIAAHSHEFKLPLLLFQAGKDRVVMPGAEDTFCRQAKNCTLLRFEHSEHDTLMETDSIRNEALRQTRDFFEQYL